MSQRRPVTAAYDHVTSVGDLLPRAAVSARRQQYSTDNNINVNAMEHVHHHHQHQQQRQDEDEDEMRRKVMQWCKWRRRYGVLSPLCIADELRRPMTSPCQ